MKSVTVGTDQSGVCLNRPLVLMCYCALLQRHLWSNFWWNILPL